ncbi:MAG: transcriptional repressor [Coriobacteriales bacterium]|nr:transcriptional repressor [Coriobacteriales bacterium]
MAARGKYKTRQRMLVQTCLESNVGHYLTVDEVWGSTISAGEHIGRSTVYRNLESMVEEGSALKAVSPGGEASYHLYQDKTSGQMVCLECRNAFPLTCHMIGELSHHVLDRHGFKILPSRTVLYGICDACRLNMPHAEQAV